MVQRRRKKQTRKRRPSRKKLTRAEIERQFDDLLSELEAEKAIRRKAEAEAKRLKKDVARLFSRPEETPTQRYKRFAVSFELETRYLMPRKGESMRAALENWASRNGWTSEELWAEYKRKRSPGFHGGMTGLERRAA